MTKTRLHEIIENVKEDYLLNVIEESTNEIEVLKTKKFLNETASIVESILMEADENGESMIDKIKNYIAAQYNNVKGTLGAAGDKLAGYGAAAKNKLRTAKNAAANYANAAAAKYEQLPAYARYGIPALAGAGLGAGLGAGVMAAMNQDNNILDQLTPEQLQELLANIGG